MCASQKGTVSRHLISAARAEIFATIAEFLRIKVSCQSPESIPSQSDLSHLKSPRFYSVHKRAILVSSEAILFFFTILKKVRIF